MFQRLINAVLLLSWIRVCLFVCCFLVISTLSLVFLHCAKLQIGYMIWTVGESWLEKYYSTNSTCVLNQRSRVLTTKENKIC